MSLSPSSDISFGWEEITVNTLSVPRDSVCGNEKVNVPKTSGNGCTNWNGNINMTSERSDTDDSVEGKERSNLIDVGVTTACKQESNLKEVISKHLEIKPDVYEKLPKDVYRMKKAHDMSESEDSYLQDFAVKSAPVVKLAKDNCRKKKTHDELRKEDSGSDREMPSLLSDEDYGIVKTRDALGLENLTEEEEIWMVQCPVSLNPQYLENKEFVFGGRSEFTLKQNAQRYETASYVDRMKPVSCLLPSRKKGTFKAKMLQPKGLIVIMEKVEVPELKITLPKQSNFQIPKGLKVRHPLFGQDYEQELEVRKQFTSQYTRMIYEDSLIQPNMLKKEKKKKSRGVDSNSTSEGTGTCNETHDEGEQESYKKEKKKKKEKKYDAEKHKKKTKFDDMFEGSEILSHTKSGKKDKREKMH